MFKQLARTVKNVVGPYDECEILVREATCNDPGPTKEEQLENIAMFILSRYNYCRVANAIWKRLQDYEHFIHVKKALRLVMNLFDISVEENVDYFPNYCLTNVESIRKLTRYRYYNNDSQDIAADVRARADEMVRKIEKFKMQKMEKPDLKITNEPQSTEDIVVNDVSNDVARDVAPGIAHDVQPDVAPSIAPNVQPDVAPNVQTDVQNEPQYESRWETFGHHREIFHQYLNTFIPNDPRGDRMIEEMMQVFDKYVALGEEKKPMDILDLNELFK